MERVWLPRMTNSSREQTLRRRHVEQDSPALNLHFRQAAPQSPLTSPTQCMPKVVTPGSYEFFAAVCSVALM